MLYNILLVSMFFLIKIVYIIETSVLLLIYVYVYVWIRPGTLVMILMASVVFFVTNLVHHCGFGLSTDFYNTRTGNSQSMGQNE